MVSIQFGQTIETFYYKSASEHLLYYKNDLDMNKFLLQPYVTCLNRIILSKKQSDILKYAQKLSISASASQILGKDKLTSIYIFDHPHP